MGSLRKDQSIYTSLPINKFWAVCPSVWSGAGGKPRIYIMYNPKLKHGEITDIEIDSVKLLPCPLGRGSSNHQKTRGFSPFL